METGALERTITIQGQPGPLNAISCITFGEDDNIFVVDEALGILKINVETNRRPLCGARRHEQDLGLAANGTSERNAAVRPEPGYPANNPRAWQIGEYRFNNRQRASCVTNHASLTGLPGPSFLFAVFDVYVNDKAGKLFKSVDDE